MNTEDFTGNTEDRELYQRLLVERDGPPIKALAERDPGLEAQRGPDPEAARHRAELEAAATPRRRKRHAE